MRFSSLLSGLTMAALTLAAGNVLAAEEGHHHEESEYPVSYVERPLTLPRLALAPEIEFEVTRLAVGGINTVGGGMTLSAAFGITKDFEVGAVVAPIEFHPAAYGNPQVFATFRFLHQKEFDLGARFRAIVVTPKEGAGAGAVLWPSVPFLYHIGKVGRFDAEVGIPIGIQASTIEGPITVVGESKVSVGLSVPLSVAFDIIEPLHIGANTGVNVGDFAHGKETTFIPLGIFGGYAIGHHEKPIVDIDGFFNFPFFVVPGAGAGADKVYPGVFQAGVAVRGYFYF